MNVWNMKCPQCGDSAQIFMLVLQEVHVSKTGFDTVGNGIVGETTPTRCKACGHVGFYPQYGERKESSDGQVSGIGEAAR